MPGEKEKGPSKRPTAGRRKPAGAENAGPPSAGASPPAGRPEGFNPDVFMRQTAPRQLEDADFRRRCGLPASEDEPGAYVFELNLNHGSGLGGAKAAFRRLWDAVVSDPGRKPVVVGKTYFSGLVSMDEWRRLLAEDEATAQRQAAAAGGVGPERFRAVFKLWPDFPVKPLTFRSVATVKADAAVRSYSADGEGIVWAVIDSGIDRRHPHFAHAANLEAGDVSELHRAFCLVDGKLLPDPDDVPEETRAAALHAHRDAALRDPFGHGTHVAGIIAGGLDDGKPAAPDRGGAIASARTPAMPVAFEREYRHDGGGKRLGKRFVRRNDVERSRVRGVAPRCRLVSLRVLDDRGNGRTSDVIRALEYVRERLNDDPKVLRIHGVNLSVGYEFDAEMFACGQSPVCAEVDRLVQAGVVVVAAAGNTGYGTVAALHRASTVGLSNTINDPGNAEMAITVGSTHRDAPHTYGVSYFSSKGPTGDGRLKPDLVAPGERITSCAAGAKLDDVIERAEGEDAETALARLAGEGAVAAVYVDDSGTSMAAPHVSGAVAAFLSIRREFIGKPHAVKKIFLDTATPLGRERYFEGHGLVDVMRAIQSV